MKSAYCYGSKRCNPGTQPVEVHIHRTETEIARYRNNKRRAEMLGWGDAAVKQAQRMIDVFEARLASLIAEAEAQETGR